jgi:hypothetical protein
MSRYKGENHVSVTYKSLLLLLLLLYHCYHHLHHKTLILETEGSIALISKSAIRQQS